MVASVNHYEWITDYLVARRMTGAVRVVMALVAGSLALCLLALLNSVDGPRATIPLAMMWTAFCRRRRPRRSAVGDEMADGAVSRWPSRWCPARRWRWRA